MCGICGIVTRTASFADEGRVRRMTEVIRHRHGGDPSSSRKSPGRTEYEAITLERGVTHDPEFAVARAIDLVGHRALSQR